MLDGFTSRVCMARPGTGVGSSGSPCLPWTCFSSPRSCPTAVLIKAHEVMMHGARGSGEEFGEGCSSTLLTTDAFAGDYQLLPPGQLQQSVVRKRWCSVSFNDAMSNPGKHPVIVAIDLMFELLRYNSPLRQ